MAHLIKNVGYGIVAKSVKLQVFLTPEKYIQAVEELKSLNFGARTDSGLINKILDIFIDQLPKLKIENQRQSWVIEKKNATIKELQEELNEIKLFKAKNDKKKVKK